MHGDQTQFSSRHLLTLRKVGLERNKKHSLNADSCRWLTRTGVDGVHWPSISWPNTCMSSHIAPLSLPPRSDSNPIPTPRKGAERPRKTQQLPAAPTCLH